MPSNRDISALRDIKDNIELAREFIADMSFETFERDRKAVYAATRCLEIISEASRRLSAELKERHANIPWSDIAAAGSVYRHGYQLVRDDVLWLTLRDRLEPLHLAVTSEIGRLE